MENKLLLILLAVAVISLAVGPIYWLRPTPRQRQLARLRAHAVKLGLRPAFKLSPPELVERGLPERLMVYSWHPPEGDWPREGERWLVIPQEDGEGGLQWLMGSAPAFWPTAPMPELPAGLQALEAGPDGVGAYWHEAGYYQRVEELTRVLMAWAAAYRASVAG